MPEDHKSVTISHETGRVVFWRDSPIFMPSALPQIPRRKIMMKLVRKLLSSLGYRLERISLPEGDLWGGNPLEDVDMYRRLYPTESVQGKRFFNVGAGAFRHPAWTNIDMKSEWYGSVQHANAGGFLEYDLLALAPLPVETDSAELLYSSHTLEHIPDGAAFNLLREAHRVLKPGGVIRLTMPDIDLFYDALRRNDVDFWYQRHTYSIETFWRRVGLRGPMSQFSIEQSFVDMICTGASQMASEETGLPRRITDEEIRSHLASDSPEQLFEFVASQRVNSRQKNQPGFHMNWWNYRKLHAGLKEAGFTDIIRSGYGQSRCPVLRNTRFFDSTHPKHSIYVEARKPSS
jgi:SAM-dependent methyltransferase